MSERGSLGILLTVPELQALDVVDKATSEQLRAALRRLPSYQRQGIRWLAREVELGELERSSTADTVPSVPSAILRARQTAQGMRQEAWVIRRALEELVARSSASPADKAFAAQHVAHLWRVLAPPADPSARG